MNRKRREEPKVIGGEWKRKLKFRRESEQRSWMKRARVIPCQLTRKREKLVDISELFDKSEGEYVDQALKIWKTNVYQFLILEEYVIVELH